MSKNTCYLNKREERRKEERIRGPSKKLMVRNRKNQREMHLEGERPPRTWGGVGGCSRVRDKHKSRKMGCGGEKPKPPLTLNTEMS